MSNQEVWITVRIKSELPVEMDADKFALALRSHLEFDNASRPRVTPVEQFLYDSHIVEVLEVEEEADICGTREKEEEE